MDRRGFLGGVLAAGGLGPRPGVGATLAKGSGPAVFVIEGGVRRHVPDPDTFFHHWQSWGQVQEVTDEVLVQTPLGLPLPSVLAGR